MAVVSVVAIVAFMPFKADVSVVPVLLIEPVMPVLPVVPVLFVNLFRSLICSGYRFVVPVMLAMIVVIVLPSYRLWCFAAHTFLLAVPIMPVMTVIQDKGCNN